MDDVLGDSAFEGDSGTLASSLLSVCFLGHEAKALVCHVTCVICCLTMSLKIRNHWIVDWAYPTSLLQRLTLNNTPFCLICLFFWRGLI